MRLLRINGMQSARSQATLASRLQKKLLMQWRQLPGTPDSPKRWLCRVEDQTTVEKNTNLVVPADPAVPDCHSILWDGKNLNTYFYTVL
jgi:hypothetical protein